MSQSISFGNYGIVAPQLLGPAGSVTLAPVPGAPPAVAAPGPAAPVAAVRVVPGAVAPGAVPAGMLPPGAVPAAGPAAPDPTSLELGMASLSAPGMITQLDPVVSDPSAVFGAERERSANDLGPAEMGLDQALAVAGGFPSEDGGAAAASRQALVNDKFKFMDSTRQTVQSYTSQFMTDDPLGSQHVKVPVNDSYREIMSFFADAAKEPTL